MTRSYASRFWLCYAQPFLENFKCTTYWSVYPFSLTPFLQGGDPDQILDCTTHKYFNLLDCISPYREPSSAFDQRLRVIFIYSSSFYVNSFKGHSFPKTIKTSSSNGDKHKCGREYKFSGNKRRCCHADSKNSVDSDSFSSESDQFR